MNLPVHLLREAVSTARSQRMLSAISCLVVAVVVLSVLVTAGQTNASRRALLATLDEAGTRQVTITDVDGKAKLSPSVVQRITSLSPTNWAFGLGPVLDGRNPLRGGDEAVASRYMTKLPPPSSYSIIKGRQAAHGEAMAGKNAALSLGLMDGAGALASDAYSVPVVATVLFKAPLEFLNDTVVILRPDQSPTLIIALADHSDHVEVLSKAVEQVLDPVRYESVRVESSSQLASIRAQVSQDSGTSSAAIITGALGAGLLLTAATSLGSVTVRRRDYGRRRALGATRSNIVVLVLAQSAVAATVGAIIGSIVGIVAVVAIEGSAPDPLLVAGVGVLSINAAMIAAVPSAMLAALRDPVRILRVP